MKFCFWFNIFIHSISFWQDAIVYTIAYYPPYAQDFYRGMLFGLRHYPEYR